MNFLNQKGRALLLLVAVVAVGAVLFVGCGDSGADTPGDNSGNNGGNGNPGINTGETVALGGKIWMKKNLNIETADSYCYDNDPSNCAIYGRLYTWEAAKAACPLAGTGWRLPMLIDLDNLAETVGGLHGDNNWPDSYSWELAGGKLKSRNGWNNYHNDDEDKSYDGNGTDDYGFSVLPGGFLNPDDHFYGVGGYGLLWTAMEGSDGGAYFYGVYSGSDAVGVVFGSVNHGFSVRCVYD